MITRLRTWVSTQLQKLADMIKPQGGGGGGPGPVK
jgi:hypothetical protein